MALFTSWTEFVLVDVILLVTRDAGNREFITIEVATMARVAFYFRVRTA